MLLIKQMWVSRDIITQNMFKEIKDPKYSLYYLLPAINVYCYVMR